MLPWLPRLFEVEAKRFVVMPAELPLQQFAIIHLENYSASARIEVELAFHRHLQDQPITSRVVRSEYIRDRRRLVIRERQERFFPIAVLLFTGARAMKRAACDRLFRHH